MKGLNKVLLLGVVSQVPQISNLSDGELMAHLRLTTLDYWKNKRTGKLQKCLQVHEVRFTYPLVDVIKACVKVGSVVYVEGHLGYSNLLDSQGYDEASLKLVGHHLEILSNPCQEHRKLPLKLASHKTINQCKN